MGFSAKKLMDDVASVLDGRRPYETLDEAGRHLAALPIHQLAARVAAGRDPGERRFILSKLPESIRNEVEKVASGLHARRLKRAC